VAAIGGGCGPSVFACSDDEDCRDRSVAGRCEADSRCSFPDEACASGRRYGAHAGTRSNTCVDDTMVASTGTSATSSTSIASSTGIDTSSTTGTTSTSDASTDTSTGADTTPISADVPPDAEPLLWLDFADPDEPFANRGSLGGAATCMPPTCPERDATQAVAVFDGIDDCLQIAHQRALASADGLTAALWLRRDLDPPDYVITTALGKPLGTGTLNSWALYWMATPDLGLRVLGAVNNRIGETGVAMPLGQLGGWVHLAITHDGATLALFVDGELADSQSGPGIGFDDSPLFIGCDDDGDGPDYHVTGALADVRVYDRVLAADEISSLAASPPAP
jgi:hypothetical protein